MRFIFEDQPNIRPFPLAFEIAASSFSKFVITTREGELETEKLCELDNRDRIKTHDFRGNMVILPKSEILRIVGYEERDQQFVHHPLTLSDLRDEHILYTTYFEDLLAAIDPETHLLCPDYSDAELLNACSKAIILTLYTGEPTAILFLSVEPIEEIGKIIAFESNGAVETAFRSTDMITVIDVCGAREKRKYLFVLYPKA